MYGTSPSYAPPAPHFISSLLPCPSTLQNIGNKHLYGNRFCNWLSFLLGFQRKVPAIRTIKSILDAYMRVYVLWHQETECWTTKLTAAENHLASRTATPKHLTRTFVRNRIAPITFPSPRKHYDTHSTHIQRYHMIFPFIKPFHKFSNMTHVT